MEDGASLRRRHPVPSSARRRSRAARADFAPIYKTDPSPSCEVVSHPDSMKRGGFISLGVSTFAGAPGSYKIEEVGVLLGDPDKGDLTMFGKPLPGTTIAVHSYDGSSIRGEVASTEGATRVTGAITGRICPGSPPRSSSSEPDEAAPEASAAPAPEPKDTPPPEIPQVDIDGVAGMTLGMSPKKLPKGATQKPMPPGKDSPDVAIYEATGLRYVGQPIQRANMVFEGGALTQIGAIMSDCSVVLSTLSERYGEGMKRGYARAWRGRKSELQVIPSGYGDWNGDCIVRLLSIPPPRTNTGSKL